MSNENCARPVQPRITTFLVSGSPPWCPVPWPVWLTLTLSQSKFTESKTTFLQFTDRNKIMSVTILLAVVNSILMTGLATIGAFLYNLVVKLVGGVYITLTDE